MLRIAFLPFVTAHLVNGIEKVHRDTYHADLGVSRYAIALTWYGFITGNDIKRNSFNEFDELVLENAIKIARISAMEALNK